MFLRPGGSPGDSEERLKCSHFVSPCLLLRLPLGSWPAARSGGELEQTVPAAPHAGGGDQGEEERRGEEKNF